MYNKDSITIETKEELRAQLYSLADPQYRNFTSSLTPGVSKDNIIGVRVPQLRRIAKQIKGSAVASDFMSDLPHRYLEENNLHGYLIEYETDFDKAIETLCDFLPYIDNWATCDTIRPKVFRKHPKKLFTHITTWIKSEHTYTIRYAIGLLLSFYLDDEFDLSHPDMVSKIKSDDYYVKMMVAWYFATALCKQYEHTVPYLENFVLDKWTHNKTIQKACESFRISDSTKSYLRTLKIK